jgi:hypothetical protein
MMMKNLKNNKEKLSVAALLVTVLVVKDGPYIIKYPLLVISIILMLWSLYDYYKIAAQQIKQKADL